MKNIIEIKVGELKVHSQHHKIYKIDEEQLAALEDAIVRQGGIQTPLAVSPNNEIIDGVLRHKIAIRLGYKTVPCIIQNYADESEAIVKIIDLNRHRIKSDTELYNEIKMLRLHCKTQQGKRSDLTGDKPINSRRQIADKINKASSYVQRLEFIGDSEDGEFLLNQLDAKKVSIAKAYELAKDTKDTNMDESRNKHVQNVVSSTSIHDVELCTCPHCKEPILKLDIIDKKL